MRWPTFIICSAHFVRFRVCDRDSISILLPDQHPPTHTNFFFSEFSKILDYSQTSIASNEAGNQQTTSSNILSWGGGLGGTGSLRWRLRILPQRWSVLFSFWGDPASKAKSMEICHAKRSGHAPGFSVKIVAPTLPRAPSLKLLRRKCQCGPCVALEPLCFSTSPAVFQPTTSPSHANVSSFSSHELVGEREHEKCTREWKHQIF